MPEYYLNDGRPETSQSPAWLNETPEVGDEYQLAMYRDGSSAQYIEITRAEFIAVKKLLAELRSHRFSPRPVGMAEVSSFKKAHETEFLEVCRELYYGNGGSNTPFEEFFSRLILHCKAGERPSPDQVQGELEGFKETFEMMLEDTQIALSRYRKHFAPEVLALAQGGNQ